MFLTMQQQDLLKAIDNNNEDDVQTLLRENKDLLDWPDEMEGNKTTPLFLAATKGNIGMIKILVEEGVSLNKKGPNGRTALHVATQNGYTEIVKYLIEKGASINEKNNFGSTPLYLAAWVGHLEIVEYLLEKNALLDEQDKQGSTALDKAVENDHLEIAKMLLQQGASIKEKNNEVLTALDLAKTKDYLEIVKLMQEKNTVNVKYYIPSNLHMAAREGDLANVKLLLEKDNYCLNRTDPDGMTALYIAAKHGHTKVVRFLLDQGASLQNNTWPNHSAFKCALMNAKFLTACYLASRMSYDNIERQIIQLNFRNFVNEEVANKNALKAWVFKTHDIQLHFTWMGNLKPDSAKILAKLLIAGEPKIFEYALRSLKEPIKELDLSNNWLNKEQLKHLIESVKQQKDLNKLTLAPGQTDLMEPEHIFYVQARFSLLPYLMKFKDNEEKIEAVLLNDYSVMLNGLGWSVLADVMKDLQQNEYFQLVLKLREKITLNNIFEVSKTQSREWIDFATREESLLMSLHKLTQKGQDNYLQVLEKFWGNVHCLRELSNDKTVTAGSDGFQLLADSKGNILLNIYEILSPANFLAEAEIARLKRIKQASALYFSKPIKKMTLTPLCKSLEEQITYLQKVEKKTNKDQSKIG